MRNDMGRKDNKKKEKIVYIDDGSTIADMSTNSTKREKKESKKPPQSQFNGMKPRATLKEQWRTYTDAVKLMFLPMLAVLGLLALAFLIIYFIL